MYEMKESQLNARDGANEITSLVDGFVCGWDLNSFAFFACRRREFPLDFLYFVPLFLLLRRGFDFDTKKE